MDSLDASASGQHDGDGVGLDHVAEIRDRDVEAAGSSAAAHAQTSNGDPTNEPARHANADAHAETHADAYPADPARPRREQDKRMMVAGPRMRRNAGPDLDHGSRTGGDRQLGWPEGQPRLRTPCPGSHDGRPSPQVEGEAPATDAHERTRRTEVRQRDRRPAGAAERDPRGRGRERRKRSLPARPTRCACDNERQGGDRCARREDHRPITVNVTVAA